MEFKNLTGEAKVNIIEKPESELEVKRFGHTMTLSKIKNLIKVNSNQCVLFGGAKSVSELYNDTFIYNIKDKSWLKFDPQGDIPGPRAAHSACCKEKDNLLLFGGAHKNGGFASNELYLLEIAQDKTKSKWSIIQCKEPKPQRRYGHTIIYVKPFLILFGGILRDKNKLTNEIWVLNLDKNYKENNLMQSQNISNNNNTILSYNMVSLVINEESNIDNLQALKENNIYEWKLVEYELNILQPPPRMYHSAGFCKSGRAKGMILIFGGRDDKKTPLNDTWGLRKHRNGNWEWIRAPCKNNWNPCARYQHSAIFYSNKMLILGGLGELNDISEKGGMPVEIFDCDLLEWSSHFSFNKFRHASFILEKYVFTFGGCDFNNPHEPSDKFVMFDVQELCNNIVIK